MPTALGSIGENIKPEPITYNHTPYHTSIYKNIECKLSEKTLVMHGTTQSSVSMQQSTYKKKKWFIRVQSFQNYRVGT